MSRARSMILHRLAHLEHEHLAALHERAGADHELDRLRDRHEVARHVAMRDGHRAARGDLAAEDRHDGARRAEHVAEPDRAERRLRVALVGGLDGPLGERLGGAHDRGGRDRLVGRDEHEGRGPGLARDLAHHPRRQRVVAHRLDRVLLHQVHVLVGGGVEDDRGPVLREHLAHPLALLAVGEHGDGVEHVAVLDQLAADLEQVVLGVVEQDELARADARDLAAQLGADRAAGARDEHDAAGQVAADAVEVHPHRLAAEDVLHLDRADLAQHGARRSAAARRPSASCAPARRARGTRSTTRARMVPGAEGIAISTSSGSTSSSTLAELARSCRARRARGRSARPACAGRRR